MLYLLSQFSNDIRRKSVNNQKWSAKTEKHLLAHERVFSEKLQSTFSFLKSNPNIFFTEADKGNVTVGMSRVDYKSKRLTLFGEESTYKIIRRNPIRRLQKSVYKILSDFNENDYLNFKYNPLQLTQTDTMLAKAYSLPKIHKPDAPLRPVISTIGSPLHFLSKIIYDEIKNALPTPKSHINNSFEFIQRISNLHIPDDYIIISLDVSSMFTNITCSDVLRSFDRRVSHIHHKCKIPFFKLREVIKFIYDNLYFSFDDKTFLQKFGSPMGLSISPPFSDIVMDDLETECLLQFKEKHNQSPIFYHRYVDDTIMCIEKEYVDTITQIFNNHNPYLKLTHEIENNNGINFLDLTLIRSENSIITNWYRKPSNSTRLLNFHSNHSLQLKKNIVFNLTDRAIKLSHKQFHKDNLNIVRQLLVDNSYPIAVVTKNVTKNVSCPK